MGDTASVFINLLILLSYSTNFFIYCAMSAQFRAALCETFSRGHHENLSITATGDGVSRQGATRRRSSGFASMTAGNSAAVKPTTLPLTNIDNDDRTGTRPRSGTKPEVGCDVIAEVDCSPNTPSIPLDDVALI